MTPVPVFPSPQGTSPMDESKESPSVKFWTAIAVSVVSGIILLWVQSTGFFKETPADARPHYIQRYGVPTPDKVADQTLLAILGLYTEHSTGKEQPEGIKFLVQDYSKEFEW